MDAEWIHGLCIIRMKRCVLVLTKDEWVRCIKRGKGIQRREEAEKRSVRKAQEEEKREIKRMGEVG